MLDFGNQTQIKRGLNLIKYFMCASCIKVFIKFLWPSIAQFRLKAVFEDGFFQSNERMSQFLSFFFLLTN